MVDNKAVGTLIEMDQNGRFYIPKRIRDHLGLKPGMICEVFFSKNHNGEKAITLTETQKMDEHIKNNATPAINPQERRERLG